MTSTSSAASQCRIAANTAIGCLQAFGIKCGPQIFGRPAARFHAGHALAPKCRLRRRRNLAHGFLSSNPLSPARQSNLRGVISGCVRTVDISKSPLTGRLRRARTRRGAISTAASGSLRFWSGPLTRPRPLRWPPCGAEMRIITCDAMLCPTISLDSRAPLLRAWPCRCLTTTSH